MSEEKDKKSHPINTVTVGYGQSEIIQKHGEAASQIIQAYKGKRYDEFGNELLHKGRSLEQISNYKVNPDYVDINIKQQAGFSAELLEESNRNHDAILRGSNIRRRTTDGIGKTNDTQYDLVDIGPDGSISNPSQMKFLGINSKGQYSVIEKLANNESWDRYDQPIDIPKDQYEKAKQYAEDKAAELSQQARKLRSQGQISKAKECEHKAERYKSAGKRIRASSVTEDDALLARTNPKKYVAQSILSDAHNAGKQAATGAVLVSGVVSLGQNICGICSGEVELEDAAISVATTTAKAGLTAYSVATTGSVIKAAMHTSNLDVIRKLGNTSLPTTIVTSTLEISRVIKQYANGEITEAQAFSELGKSGAGSLAASYGAAVGTILLPGIGTMVGSMVGYMISSAIYDSCLQVFTEADLAHDNYIRTKELCEAARDSMRQQRLMFEAEVNKLLQHRQITITQSTATIMNSLESLDTTDFTQALSNLAAEFGRELQFRSFDDFDQKMSPDDFVLIL